MADEQSTHPVTLSRQALATATAISLVLAAIGLTVVVLPSSYGIDPTGAGQALGFQAPPDLPDELSSPAEEVTLVLDPGLQATRAHTLSQGQLIQFHWESQVPLAFTLRGSGGPAAQEGILIETEEPTTFLGRTLEIPADGTYVWSWENANTTRVEGTFRLAVGHGPTGGSP